MPTAVPLDFHRDISPEWRVPFVNRRELLFLRLIAHPIQPLNNVVSLTGSGLVLTIRHDGMQLTATGL